MAMDGPQPADDAAAFHGSAPGHGGSRMLQADTWFQAAWRWTLEGGHAGDLLVQIRDIHSYLHRRCNVALWLASTTIAQRSAITGCAGCRRKRVAECERVIGGTGVYVVVVCRQGKLAKLVTEQPGRPTGAGGHDDEELGWTTLHKAKRARRRVGSVSGRRRNKRGVCLAAIKQAATRQRPRPCALLPWHALAAATAAATMQDSAELALG